MMKRSRGFILSEILMTMILQAGFILTLFGAFYLMMEFYTKTQAVLTARDHAERVIQFMDDKIRAAGLGLWACTDDVDGDGEKEPNSATIRGRLSVIPKLKTSRMFLSNPNEGYKLPVAIWWFDEEGVNGVPKLSNGQDKGNILVLLYAEPHIAEKKEEELVMLFSKKDDFRLTTEGNYTKGQATITMIDDDSGSKSLFTSKHKFHITQSEKNIGRWAVSEAMGVPFYIPSIGNYPDIGIFFYGGDAVSTYAIKAEHLPETLNIPDAGELMYLKCMQMFVHDNNDGQGRQFAFRELNVNGDTWLPTNGYNQEKNILDIYMELDTSTNIFTLYVLAQGGYDAGVSNPRPESWPKEATPSADNDDDAKTAWLAHDYCHYTVYVSRASWKLNNIPEDFSWN